MLSPRWCLVFPNLESSLYPIFSLFMQVHIDEFLSLGAGRHRGKRGARWCQTPVTHTLELGEASEPLGLALTINSVLFAFGKKFSGHLAKTSRWALEYANNLLESASRPTRGWGGVMCRFEDLYFFHSWWQCYVAGSHY